MSSAVQRSMLLALMVTMADSVVADNTELWDLYPSSMEFSQYDENTLSTTTQAAWFTFAAGAGSLNGVSISLTVEDGQQKVTLDASGAAPFKVAASADWQWSQIFTDGFVAGNCDFVFTVELGAVLLPLPEGYRIGQREILSWSGEPDVCEERVKSYLSKAEIDPVMPLHVAAWWSVGDLQKPATVGRLEFALIQDLRRSKRLLPLEKTAEVDADPFTGKLRSPGTAEDRFALVQSRLGETMFADGFESN